ncbi:hypothetical protein BD780_000784 [Clostridium tetanomorphum]|uniref:Uncharacterized protein n=1 Tax=Clostridium tetanomorphum TaxID=1553 RepID=A0A923J0J9_CLOTT|nr:hypothetical protein [Clostridium tetanomorphum]KAJ52542.1 hypothetical protein CTM_07161 [Clostridium tetanomorphum DSM 665]MBC2396308.1 hypothetical protein [Clostridium tetanomorphum]MBP1863462.1 hypothetical protein [Clostridium tetanomorphum]NRS83559.1 hypothetical protein [Clostridium tetanomorphum]NRZ96759.1 hypothetical protein [Clostridium tetanomorphum]
MSEQLRGYYSDGSKNRLDPSASAFAYNKNCNILVVPCNNESVIDSLENKANEGATQKTSKDTLDDIMKKFSGDDEVATESKACGKVDIENINLNLIIVI